MKTTIFTKVIDPETLFVFEFLGEVHNPHQQGCQRKRVGLLTKEGFVEQRYNTPPGAYTKIENLNFKVAMKLSMDNVKKMTALFDAKKAIEKAALKAKKDTRYQQAMENAMATGKGWYSVDVSALVMKHKGNDGWVDQSVRVLANNGFDAYNKASDFIQNPKNFEKNVMLVQYVEEFEAAQIDYIGVLTD